MTDETDDLIRAAAKAHEALAAADYFDGLPARVMARLARSPREPEVAMMSETNNDSPRGAIPPPVGDAKRTDPTGHAESNEDSGLHDVKSLAQTTKQRISRRITSQHDAYNESLLSSSQSGLRAVALPAPAQIVSLPDLPPGAVAGRDDRGAAVSPIGARAGARNRTIWLVAAGGVLAAAAAAAIVIGSGGGGKGADDGLLAAGTATAVEQAGDSPESKLAVTGGSGAVAAGSGSATATVTALADPAAPAPGQGSGEVGAAGAAKDRAGKPDDGRAGKGADARDGKPGGDKAAGGGKGTKGDDKPKVGGGGAGAGSGADKSIEDLLAQASGGAQKATDQGGGDSAKPEKTGLDGKDIRTGMGAVAGKAQACVDQHGVAGHVKVKAVVDTSGKVSKVDVTGEFAGTPTGSCVAAAARSASFPSWTGVPMTISYGFTLQE